VFFAFLIFNPFGSATARGNFSACYFSATPMAGFKSDHSSFFNRVLIAHKSRDLQHTDHFRSFYIIMARQSQLDELVV